MRTEDFPSPVQRLGAPRAAAYKSKGARSIGTAAALLAAIVESSDDAILSKNLRGIILSWNRGAQNLFGYTAAEIIGQPITVLIPDDRQGEETTILARLRAGERVEHFETTRRRKDGTLIDISLTVSPIHNAKGEVVGASKIARDIGDRKRHEQRQALLLREMHHRVKNSFALAGALVSLAAKSASSPETLAHSIRERLLALSKAHELTLPALVVGNEAERSTGFATLIAALTAPYQYDEHPRILLKGEDFEVSSRALTNVALLFHEFVTNSAKYGALSQSDGQIHIETILNDGAIQITWEELGGPPVVPPTESAGFGSYLEVPIKLSLNATIEREWRPEGLCITLTVPPEEMCDTALANSANSSL